MSSCFTPLSPKTCEEPVNGPASFQSDLLCFAYLSVELVIKLVDIVMGVKRGILRGILDQRRGGVGQWKAIPGMQSKAALGKVVSVSVEDEGADDRNMRTGLDMPYSITGSEIVDIYIVD